MEEQEIKKEVNRLKSLDKLSADEVRFIFYHDRTKDQMIDMILEYQKKFSALREELFSIRNKLNAYRAIIKDLLNGDENIISIENLVDDVEDEVDDEYTPEDNQLSKIGVINGYA